MIILPKTNSLGQNLILTKLLLRSSPKPLYTLHRPQKQQLIFRQCEDQFSILQLRHIHINIRGHFRQRSLNMMKQISHMKKIKFHIRILHKKIVHLYGITVCQYILRSLQQACMKLDYHFCCSANVRKWCMV